MSRHHGPFLLLLPLAAALACSDLAAAEAPIEKVVAARRSEARRLATQRKYDAALERLADARNRIQQAGRKAAAPASSPPLSAAYRRELQELAAWLRKQQEPAGGGKADVAAGLNEYSRRRAALDRKYGRDRPSRQEDASLGRRRAGQARYLLLRASVDDTAAEILRARGAAADAKAMRLQAALARLRAHEALGKHQEAAGAAERVVELKPADPNAYSAVGRYYQRRGRFDRAAAVWQQGIDVIEGGGSEPRGVRPSHQLEEFYRQLAFCWHRLGKQQEMRRALDRATRLGEAAGRSRAER